MGDLANVPGEAVRNWHNESPLFDGCMLIEMKKQLKTRDDQEQVPVLSLPWAAPEAAGGPCVSSLVTRAHAAVSAHPSHARPLSFPRPGFDQCLLKETFQEFESNV